MIAAKQPTDPMPLAERLAKALRDGMELRREAYLPYNDFPEPFYTDGDVRSYLEPYCNSLDFFPPVRKNPISRAMGALRRLVKKMMAPWLHIQTHYNKATMNVLTQLMNSRLEDIERIQNLENRMKAQEAFQEDCRQSSLDFCHTIEKMEERHYQRVNRELGWQGEIAKAGLWFNPPVIVQFGKGGPQVRGITERILEHIFVHTRLPRPPARVLDLGCSESTNAIEMATLGYEVVGVDLRPLPLKHPSFTMVEANLSDMPFEDNSFDVAVALSTIEHVGLGWYTEEERGSSDQQTIAEVLRVLKPGGKFLLTTPFGRAGQTPVHRIYDRTRLRELLQPFREIERAYGVRDGEDWSFTLDEKKAEGADGIERVSAVCLMVLEKP